VRALSALTKTDCIFLEFTKEAFDILLKERIKKEREELGKFVYESIPGLKSKFGLAKIINNCHLLF